MKKYSNILYGLVIGIILSIGHKFLVLPQTSKFVVENNLQFYVSIVSAITFVIYTTFIMYKTENKKLDKLKIFYLIVLDIFLLISNSFAKTNELSFIYNGIKNILYTIIFLTLHFIVYASITSSPTFTAPVLTTLKSS